VKTGCRFELEELRSKFEITNFGSYSPDFFSRDRADYNEKLEAHVSYSVKGPGDAPSILTYGPSFFALAAKYPGRVTIGE
jgi:hypothetical protein